MRYTTKDKYIYATLFGWPGADLEIVFSAFSLDQLPEPLIVKQVDLLGSELELKWQQSDGGLSVQTPSEAPDEIAVVFKISLE